MQNSPQTHTSPLHIESGPAPLTPISPRLAGLAVDGFSTRSTRRRRSRPSSSWADAGAARTDAGGRLFYVPFACGPGPLYARKWPAAGGIVAVSRAFCVLRCVVCPFMNPSKGADVVKIVCSGVSHLLYRTLPTARELRRGASTSPSPQAVRRVRLSAVVTMAHPPKCDTRHAGISDVEEVA